MTRVVAFHSYRGGTGKTNVAANVAAELVRRGRRLAVVDVDIQSPGIHVLFGCDPSAGSTLNDFLWGRCRVEEAAFDVTATVERSAGEPAGPARGRLSLVPASVRTADIARVLKEGYDVEMLNDGLMALCRQLDLDYLLIDTHPGINEETLLSIAIADIALILLRPDHQDYQGTAVTLELARRLEVPRILLVVNKMHPEFDAALLATRIAETYAADVGATIPMSDEMLRLGSGGLFSLADPGHPFSVQIRRLVTAIDG